MQRDYPQAILHIDGDAFFASCEVAKNPKLRGKPVVVGGARGIAVAMTYAAKARGVTRGMPVHQIKQICPEVVILNGDYELYGQIAERMYAIVRRYTPIVEEYSVDECFADLTGMRAVVGMEYEEIAKVIKHDLETELGTTFSVGLATTKVLAKVASKHNKPSGLVCIPKGSEQQYLENLSCGKVWGIGPATAEKLYRQKVTTALQLATQPAWWIQETLSKNHRALVQELRGESVYSVHGHDSEAQKSIAATRTFKPPTADKAFIFSQLSKNIEEACRHARAAGLAARHIYCFLKSQEFQYLRFEVVLGNHSNIPSEVLAGVTPLFEQMFRPGILYRATGVTLGAVRPVTVKQADLFGADIESEGNARVFAALDQLGHKYGKHAVHLGSSMKALAGYAKQERPHLNLPYLGEVQ